MNQPRADDPTLRNFVRRPITVAAKLRAGGVVYHVQLLDLSASGFRFQCMYPISPGRHCTLRLDTFEPMGAEIIWFANEIGGAKFDRLLHPAVAEAIGKRHSSLFNPDEVAP